MKPVRNPQKIDSGCWLILITMEKLIPIKLNFRNMELIGKAVPLEPEKVNGVPIRFSVAIDDLFDGTIECTDKGWKCDEMEDGELIEAIGSYLQEWYE